MRSASRLTFSLPFGQSSRESHKRTQPEEQSDAECDDCLDGAGGGEDEIHAPHSHQRAYTHLTSQRKAPLSLTRLGLT